MKNRSIARLGTLILAGFTSIAAAGCMVDDGLDGESEAEAAEAAEAPELEQLDEQATDPTSLERPVGGGETNIQVRDYNGICADSLTMRDVPGGYTLCTMGYRNPVYVYDVNGAWAYVRALAGGCEGHVGWALKDYISRRCL